MGVIPGRKFSNSKVSGRNASEPISSFVNELEKPTLLSEVEGRRMSAGITEVALVVSRSSRVGMIQQTNCPVLETRIRGWGGHRPLCIRKRKRSGLMRESEGFIVPFETKGQHNLGRGKEPCFVHATKEWRVRGLPCC